MQVKFRLAVNFVAIVLLNSFAVKPSLSQTPLPPPPNVPVFPPRSAPLPINPAPTVPRQPLPEVAPDPNERVFTAPRANPDERVFTAPRGAVNGGYRVIVDSASPFVLQQVRAIQPDAFFQTFQGRRVIQVGWFSDEFKARQQVSRFSAQGIRAEITTGSPGSGFEPSDPRRGYYAIVPGDRIDVQYYRDRAIRLGVSRSLVQVRERPRGLHLAVGPFANQREAEQVVRYLRDRGNLDARLFYDR